MKNVIVSGPLVFSEQNCPSRAGEIINSISEIYDIPNPRVGMQVYVKNEGKNYTITGLREKVIEGVAVPNAQVDTYRCVEVELLKRLQGVSENSNASTDPFKFIGNYDNFEALIEKLDTMHGNAAATAQQYNGHFRARVGTDMLVDIVNEVQGYKTDVWSQRITCAGIVLRNEVLRTEESYSQYSSESTHKYRLHRYKQKFVDSVGGGPNFDTKGGVKTFCRRHYLTNNVSTWTPWYDVENPYVQSQNYGKRIAIFGGSFAQNMAVNSSDYQFTHEGTSYNLVDYVAEKLGATAFDDYAVGGQGMRSDEDSPFPVHINRQLQTSLSVGGVYDIYIIMGGVNDWWRGDVPLGDCAGYSAAVRQHG
jgi:hypothetical protein